MFKCPEDEYSFLQRLQNELTYPLERFLEELNFVDLIVFGKWNYDKRANTEEARNEYARDIEILTDFCKSNNIRLHVKSDTMKFANP